MGTRFDFLFERRAVFLQAGMGSPQLPRVLRIPVHQDIGQAKHQNQDPPARDLSPVKVEGEAYEDGVIKPRRGGQQEPDDENPGLAAAFPNSRNDGDDHRKDADGEQEKKRPYQARHVEDADTVEQQGDDAQHQVCLPEPADDSPVAGTDHLLEKRDEPDGRQVRRPPRRGFMTSSS